MILSQILPADVFWSGLIKPVLQVKSLKMKEM